MELSAQRRLRLVIGAVTLALVGWGLYAIFDVLTRGPDANRFQVWVLFKDVQGLQTGSRVRHRGMTVGGIAALELDAPAGRVRALVTLEPEARALVKTTSEFWVVRPRFTDISDGPSGLDTLIKESYLRLRVRSTGEQLEDGEELLGLEGPPDDLAEEDLDDPMVGDLLATVKLPDAHGLKPGSPVLYRGQPSGEVRRVALSSDGNGVLVRFRVLRRYRHLLCEKSRVWVARPVLQGSIFTGITVSSLGSLLQAAVVFDTSEKAGEPVADGAVLAGLPSPPPRSEREWDAGSVDTAERTALPGERGGRVHLLSPWVQVRYRAIEKDTLSADDEVESDGDGVLFRGPRGDLCVLTARSACDGTFLVTDGFLDSIRIRNERIRVVLQDGRVWPARRTWTAPDDVDLAVLRLQTPVNADPAPLPAWTTYLDLDAEPPEDPQPQRAPPFVVKKDGKAIGMIGQAKQDAETRARVSFASLPQELRPRGQ